MLSSRGNALTSDTHNQNNGKATNNKRRAFRDVTNANQNADSKSIHLVEKKNVHAVPSVRSSHSNDENVGRTHRQKSNEPTNGALRTSNRGLSVHTSQTLVQRQHSSKSSILAKSSSSVVSRTGSYQHTGQVDNIDERDASDPLCASEYVKGMYEHFRAKEHDTAVRPVYMERQTHINEKMRAILTDWLVEVHLKFKLVPETLYLTINLIDRYLERTEVSRPKLQLVGVTCLLIGSKYEEIYPPELRDLVYICDRAYSKKEILDMEEVILKSLKYKITIPSAHAFLVRYLKAGHADKKMVQLACYILDGTLQSYHLLNYLPSQLAAAAVFIARSCIGRNSWSPTLLSYAGYCEEEIIPVARAVMQEKQLMVPELRAVNKKYSSTRYGNVAETPLVFEF